LGFLALGLTGTLLLITDFMFGGLAAAIAGIGCAAVVVWLWFGLRLVEPGSAPASAGRPRAGSVSTPSTSRGPFDAPAVRVALGIMVDCLVKSSRSSVVSDVHPVDSNKLIAQWQIDRDERSRDELVRRFLPLARKLARRYQGAGEPLDDLVQVASLALVKAIDRFDVRRGTAFTSFAVPTIAGELKRYFRDLGWSAHVPRGAQERALKVEAAARTLTARAGRSPTVDELAVYLELSVEEVIEALEAAAAHHAKSLDAPHDDGDGECATLADTLGHDDQRFEFVDVSATIRWAVHQLSERDRAVLALRFVEDRTQSEIAEQVGVSQMQVSRILRRSISQVRETLEEGGGDSAQALPDAGPRLQSG
jgi:RNA polymerase sigma-B factor